VEDAHYRRKDHQAKPWAKLSGAVLLGGFNKKNMLKLTEEEHQAVLGENKVPVLVCYI
jgi:hypothetical protein